MQHLPQREMEVVERRAHRRVGLLESHATVRSTGESFPIIDFSPGGVCLGGVPELSVLTRVDLVLDLGRIYTATCTGKIVRAFRATTELPGIDLFAVQFDLENAPQILTEEFVCATCGECEHVSLERAAPFCLRCLERTMIDAMFDDIGGSG